MFNKIMFRNPANTVLPKSFTVEHGIAVLCSTDGILHVYHKQNPGNTALIIRGHFGRDNVWRNENHQVRLVRCFLALLE